MFVLKPLHQLNFCHRFNIMTSPSLFSEICVWWCESTVELNSEMHYTNGNVRDLIPATTVNSWMAAIHLISHPWVCRKSLSNRQRKNYCFLCHFQHLCLWFCSIQAISVGGDGCQRQSPKSSRISHSPSCQWVDEPPGVSTFYLGVVCLFGSPHQTFRGNGSLGWQGYLGESERELPPFFFSGWKVVKELVLKFTQNCCRKIWRHTSVHRCVLWWEIGQRTFCFYCQKLQYAAIWLTGVRAQCEEEDCGVDPDIRGIPSSIRRTQVQEVCEDFHHSGCFCVFHKQSKPELATFAADARKLKFVIHCLAVSEIWIPLFTCCQNYATRTKRRVFSRSTRRRRPLLEASVWHQRVTWHRSFRRPGPQSQAKNWNGFVFVQNAGFCVGLSEFSNNVPFNLVCTGTPLVRRFSNIYMWLCSILSRVVRTTAINCCIPFQIRAQLKKEASKSTATVTVDRKSKDKQAGKKGICCFKAESLSWHEFMFKCQQTRHVSLLQWIFQNSQTGCFKGQCWQWISFLT